MLSKRSPDESPTPLTEPAPSADRQRGLELLEQAQELETQDESGALAQFRLVAALARPVNDVLLMMQAEAGIGRILMRQGNGEQAEQHLLAALDACQGHNELRIESEIRRDLGRAFLEQGQYQEARTHLNTALLLSESWPTLQAEIHNLKAGLAHATGGYEDALKELQLAEELFASAKDVEKRIVVLGNLGILLNSVGRYPEAIERLSMADSLSLSCEKKGKTLLRQKSNINLNLGNVFFDMGDFASAENFYAVALRLSIDSESTILAANATLNLALSQKALGKSQDAETTFRQALELAEEGQYRHFEAPALDGLGQILLHQGRLPEAEEAFQRAWDIAQETGDLEDQVDTLLHLGEVEQRLGQVEAAQQVFQAALERATQAGRPKAECDAHRALYELHAGQQDSVLALRHLEQLYRLEREILNSEVDQRVRDMTGKLELERVQHQAELMQLRAVAAEEARTVAEAQVQDRTLRLERAQLDVVTRLAVAAEYRDDTTGEHTWRVGQISAAIAAHLGWQPEDVDLIRLASRLHDVGKIGIPDSILLKPGKLTPEEFTQMQAHTNIGQRILSGGQTPLLHMAEDIALHHHERWGGGGYPQGLVGQAIPLSARIVAVADVFDALTHARSYKAAWSVAEALQEVRSLSGSFFDPQVVDAALAVLPLDLSGEGSNRQTV